MAEKLPGIEQKGVPSPAELKPRETNNSQLHRQVGSAALKGAGVQPPKK